MILSGRIRLNCGLKKLGDFSLCINYSEFLDNQLAWKNLFHGL